MDPKTIHDVIWDFHVVYVCNAFSAAMLCINSCYVSLLEKLWPKASWLKMQMINFPLISTALPLPLCLPWVKQDQSPAFQ